MSPEPSASECVPRVRAETAPSARPESTPRVRAPSAHPSAARQVRTSIISDSKAKTTIEHVGLWEQTWPASSPIGQMRARTMALTDLVWSVYRFSGVDFACGTEIGFGAEMTGVRPDCAPRVRTHPLSDHCQGASVPGGASEAGGKDAAPPSFHALASQSAGAPRPAKTPGKAARSSATAAARAPEARPSWRTGGAHARRCSAPAPVLCARRPQPWPPANRNGARGPSSREAKI